MAKLGTVPTRSDLEALVPEIVRVIGQSYAFLLWFTHVSPRLTKDESGYAVILSNSLFEGTMLNLRKLNEFFKSSGKRDDDARAIDFPGFSGAGPFLRESELKEIHKRFAHLTYHQILNGHGVWNMAEVMESALKASLPFINYLIEDFYEGDPKKAELVIALHNVIPRVLGQIDKIRISEQNNSA